MKDLCRRTAREMSKTSRPLGLGRSPGSGGAKLACGGTTATWEDEKVRQRVRLCYCGVVSGGERRDAVGELLAARAVEQ
jgi:hypothetical protein